MSLDVYLRNDMCSHCGRGEEVYEANITYNLAGMAEEAGIYGIVWAPEENGITHAGQLVAPLRKAIADMIANPERYKKHDAPNGWGTYEHFVPWLQRYLAACEKHPNAGVKASR